MKNGTTILSTFLSRGLLGLLFWLAAGLYAPIFIEQAGADAAKLFTIRILSFVGAVRPAFRVGLVNMLVKIFECLAKKRCHLNFSSTIGTI